jgi:hypothetical protein
VPGGGAPTSACSETGGSTPTSACSGAGTGTRHPPPQQLQRSSCYRAALFATINSSVSPINASCRKGRPTSASAASGEISKFAGDQLNEAGTAEQIERH